MSEDKLANATTLVEYWRKYHDGLPGYAPPGMAMVSEAAFYAGSIAMLDLVEKAFKQPTTDETAAFIERVQAEVKDYAARAREVVRRTNPG